MVERRGRQGLRRQAQDLPGSKCSPATRPRKVYGTGFPDETLTALRDFVVSIKGPLGTPVGGGMRSLNVAMRQNLDLYACVRPIRYFPGVVDADGRRLAHRHGGVPREHRRHLRRHRVARRARAEVQRLIYFLQNELKVSGIRFPASSGIGIKPVSKEGSQRLVRKAIQYAIENDRVSVTLVHKGNIMKYTEGAFMQWGYLAREGGVRRAAHRRRARGCSFKNPINGNEIVIKDVIADNFLQQVLLRPEDYDVIATLNLNGDYISGRAGGAGGRHRHRAGRQHRRRPRGVRGDARHGAGLRRQGSRQSGLDRSCRPR